MRSFSELTKITVALLTGALSTLSLILKTDTSNKVPKDTVYGQKNEINIGEGF